jgi:hypothetical protein
MPENSDKDDPRDTVQRGADIGEMHARREQMADGRRYVIYYTFGEQSQDRSNGKEEAAAENV